MKTRVRFAPSPTGPLHIGGLRTALFNYLFARKNNGVFILRVEDTDQNRYVEGSEAYIQKSLEWAGMVPDEGPFNGGEFGPYRQSERKEIYKEYIDLLIQKGGAYYAFDKTEDLSNERAAADSEGRTFLYGAQNRMLFDNSLNLSPEETAEKIKGDYVVRLKVEPGQNVTVFDEIRGTIHLDSSLLDDKILMKSDGMPTYHFANVVDDHLMQISCVIRGEEWLPSAPLHVMLYEAFGWECPLFAHLPLLLKPDGNGKLSKRDGDRLGFPVFPTNWTTAEGELYSGYREKGYHPGAFINMLALLGWNPGTTQELFNLDELVEAFSLERVSKSGAKFDPDKTLWFQQQYLRSQSDESLAKELKILLPSITQNDYELSIICGLMKERATFVKDIHTDGHYLFERPNEWDTESIRKKWKQDTTALLTEWLERMRALSTFDAASIEIAFKQYLEERSLGIGAVLLPFRLVVTGVGAGPGMFDISAFLGQQEVVERMQLGIKVIQEIVNEA